MHCYIIEKQSLKEARKALGMADERQEKQISWEEAYNELRGFCTTKVSKRSWNYDKPDSENLPDREVEAFLNE